MKNKILKYLFTLVVTLTIFVSGATVKILLVGDTQHILNNDSTYGKPDWFKTAMKNTVTDPVTRDADCLITMGDNIETGRNNNIPKSYDDMEIAYNNLNGKIPYFFNKGNNDNSTEFVKEFPLNSFPWNNKVLKTKDGNLKNAIYEFSAEGSKLFGCIIRIRFLW